MTMGYGVLALAALLAVASDAVAQRIDGRVLSARDSTPEAGALAQLLDGAGTRVAQTSTGADGAFRLTAPVPGRYVVAVLRIGQRPWRSDAADLPAGAVRQMAITVPDDPIQLAAISVEARSACRASPDDGSLIGSLLAEAEKALTLTRLAMGDRTTGYSVLTWRRDLTLRFETIDSVATLLVDAGWPIRSAPPESLAVHGFVREEAPTDEHPIGVSTYFGPDAQVLFSPWFLGTHCFRVSEGTGADGDALVLAFEPARGRRGVDITGRLVIARRSLGLRLIEWRYVGLPRWVALDRAGGALTLARLPSGAYIPWSWWMRAPVAELDRFRRPWKVAGWAETGGEVLGPR